MKCAKQIVLLLVCFLSISYSYSQKSKNIRKIDYVDPFIGTGFHGHTFPGAVVPFGGVQLSPDTRINGWDACSGYYYADSKMYGFSHTHLSGTGIGDLGDVLFLPYTGKAPLDSVTSFSHDKEKASPGYYSVILDDYAIKCELSATKRMGWHKYTYPKGKQSGLLIDLGHLLRRDWPSAVLEGSIKVINNKTIEGYHLTNGWAAHDPIWFRAEFDEPFEVTKLVTEKGEQQGKSDATGTDIKMYLTFGNLSKPLTIKVSISGVDETGPRINMKEIKGGASFEDVVALAQEQWEETLSTINIKSEDKSVLTNFYTAMYHSHLAPTLFSDFDGRYMGMDKKIHKAISGESYTTFSLWDTFRAWFPLMTIIQPEKSKQWVYNLYQASEEDLLLPKWPLRGNYTATMVGYPSMAIMADAITKGLADSIPHKLVAAGIRSATWQPEWRQKHIKTRAKGVTNIFMAIKEEFGYLPADKYDKTVTWGLEMAYYDWCLGIMAKEAGDEKTSKEWLAKGQYYRHYFDPSTGYMRGKKKDGTWLPNFDPSYSSHKKGQFIEGNSYQWSPFVPHDIEGLKGLIGGNKKFASWLDTLFMTDSKLTGEDVSMDITGLIGQYAHGNEPGHHIPYLYNYAKRPDRTAEIVDKILYDFYLPTPEGIIGNEDCGQMSAWYVMSAMGFYQVCPGKPIYDLGRPIVDEAKIKVKDGFFTIKVHNNSKENKYIEKAYLNGKKLANSQFSHSSIKSAGVLDIYMSSSKK
ncbi:Glycosyl hydrolase family 92 [compost metagenome]